MTTDATKRPLRIPVSYQNYAEEQGVFDLVGQMLESLLIVQPGDPLQHMINYLEGDDRRRVRVAIVGPPGSGKSSVAHHLAEEANAKLVTNLETFLAEGATGNGNGWVLDGFPQNRSEAIKLQEHGYLIDYLFVLYGPCELMKERQNGKKIDKESGMMYHPVFNWTNDSDIINRLEEVATANSFTEDYAYYQKNRESIISTHEKVETTPTALSGR